MGSYFSRLFTAQGHRVIGSDVIEGRVSPNGPRFAHSNPEAARGSDVVVLAVPITETLKVAREISPDLKKGSLVVEIASIKGKIPEGLRRTLRTGNASLLSIHPLFGPLTKSPHPKIAVVGGAGDLSAARSLFPNAELICIGSREHDRLMASVLSLVHLTNLAFVSTVAKEVGIDEYNRVSTPMGSAQMNLAKAVLSGSPSLSTHIQLENPFVEEVITTMLEELQDLRRAIALKDYRGFERKISSLSNTFGRVELDDALRQVYSGSGRFQLGAGRSAKKTSSGAPEGHQKVSHKPKA